eukprot:scaffold7689_cov139-Skeletonema_menzelii.AAC.1
MHYAKCFEDKCEIISISITLLFDSGKITEGVKATLSTLASLGEELSSSPRWVPQLVIDYVTPSVVQKHLSKTEAKLAGLSDEALMSYPIMVDPSKIMAMELLAKLSELAWYAGKHAQLPLIPSKMIQISLKHGMSALSPLAFVNYGNCISLTSENYEVGYQYVKLGLALMKQSPSRVQDGQVIFHSAYTRMHVEPMQTAVELYLDGFNAAMRSGDTGFAMKCAYFYDVCSFWAGMKLDDLAESMKETLMRLRFHKNLLIASMMLPIVRLTLRMVGEAANTQQNSLTSVFRETHGEEDMADKIPLVMRTNYFMDCYEAFIYRRFGKVTESAEKIFSLNVLNTSNSKFVMCNRILETNDKVWIARGADSKVSMEKLAVLASTWNFQNKTYLLQAEEQFSARNFDDAEKLYDDAILSSKKHKFVNEEALANELAGHFYLETGRKYKSLQYFYQAEEKYREWGAVTKADELATYLRSN